MIHQVISFSLNDLFKFAQSREEFANWLSGILRFSFQSYDISFAPVKKTIFGDTYWMLDPQGIYYVRALDKHAYLGYMWSNVDSVNHHRNDVLIALQIFVSRLITLRP